VSTWRLSGPKWNRVALGEIKITEISLRKQRMVSVMEGEADNEIARVKQTVRNYVDGVVGLEFQKGEDAWDPEGLKISYDAQRKKLHTVTILETRPNLSPEEIESARKMVSQRGTIQTVDRTGDAASVKLLWHYARGGETREITDYILLLRISDEWKIVAKVFNESLLSS